MLSKFIVKLVRFNQRPVSTLKSVRSTARMDAAAFVLSHHLKHTECRPRGEWESRYVSGSVKNCSGGAVMSSVLLDVPIVTPEYANGLNGAKDTAEVEFENLTAGRLVHAHPE